MNTEQLQDAARIALGCLDLTTLNNRDSEVEVERLCKRAQGPFGQVAAVCVWPRLAGFARNRLPDSIRVAAVANFPNGYADVERAVRDTREIVAAGAQEVDLVLPWQYVLRGDDAAALKVLQATRDACPDLTLKVILETGMLLQHEAISRASRLALQAGADFLKTSTGKTSISATPEAGRLMLEAIRQDPAAADRVGFKPSGGIRTVSDVAIYIELVRSQLGAAALTAGRFRIGASSVLDDIERVLAGEASHSDVAPGVY